MGFKARVGSVLFALGRTVHVARSLRFTFGARPADLLVANCEGNQLSYASWAFFLMRLRNARHRTPFDEKESHCRYMFH